MSKQPLTSQPLPCIRIFRFRFFVQFKRLLVLACRKFVLCLVYLDSTAVAHSYTHARRREEDRGIVYSSSCLFMGLWMIDVDVLVEC